MVSRDAVTEVALDFLKAVASLAKAELGDCPLRQQNSTWMVNSGPGSMTGNKFTREVFDRLAVSIFYQTTLSSNDFTEQQRLIDILVSVGIPSNEIHNHFLVPLVNHWLELPDPFKFEDRAISQVLGEFADVITSGKVLVRLRTAVDTLELTSGPVELDKGISIRPVNEEELWEFGDDNNLGRFHPPLPWLTEDWILIDIKLSHVSELAFSSSVIIDTQRAVLTALRLASPGRLRVVDLGRQANYGMGSVGRLFERRMALEYSKGEGSYILDTEVAQLLKESWAHLYEIMVSDEHFLRLPAQRFVDAGMRNRADDAIVDYAIGLEALLTEGIREELRYRFALRGATILSWQRKGKKKFFIQLRELYDIRSAIVHGSHMNPAKLGDTQSNGEQTLRAIWWWYFNSGASLPKATTDIDNRILR